MSSDTEERRTKVLTIAIVAGDRTIAHTRAAAASERADVVATILASALLGDEILPDALNDEASATWISSNGRLTVTSESKSTDDRPGDRETLEQELAAVVAERKRVGRRVPTSLHLRMGRLISQIRSLGISPTLVDLIAARTGYSSVANRGVQSKQQAVHEQWILRFGLDAERLERYGMTELYAPLSRRRKNTGRRGLGSRTEAERYLTLLDQGMAIEQAISRLDL
jgi:hypothetical protein